MATATKKVGSIKIVQDGPILRIRDRPGQGGDSAMILIALMGFFFIAFAIIVVDGFPQVVTGGVGVVLTALAIMAIVPRLRGFDTIIVDRSAGTVTRGETPAAASGVLALDMDHTTEFRRDEDGDEVGNGYPVWAVTLTDGHQSQVLATSKSRHDILRIHREVGVMIENDAAM